jgi:hypothetical protein
MLEREGGTLTGSGLSSPGHSPDLSISPVPSGSFGLSRLVGVSRPVGLSHSVGRDSR